MNQLGDVFQALEEVGFSFMLDDEQVKTLCYEQNFGMWHRSHGGGKVEAGS